MSPLYYQCATLSHRLGLATLPNRACQQQRLPHQQIADQLLCDDETIRRVIKAFNTQGLSALQPCSSRPKRTRDTFSEKGRTRLAQLVRQSLRTFGKKSSIWMLDLLAEVPAAEGLTPRKVSDETIHVALKRLGIAWRHAKHHISSLDLTYTQKKRRCDRLIDLGRTYPNWVIGFQDETWWSRLV